MVTVERIEVFQDIAVSKSGGGVSTVWMAVDNNYYGCMAQGNTREEALASLDEARKDYIAVLEERRLEEAKACMLASEPTLAREWLTPEEDEAWKDL